MRKIVVLLGVIMLMMSLAGCSLLKGFVNEEYESKKMALKIIEALENKDEDALRNVFSPKALAEADDFDEGLEYIMNVYEGSLVKCERNTSHGSNHFGTPGRTWMVEVSFNVVTDKQTYYLGFRYWIINEQDPNAEGLYTIKLDSRETTSSEGYFKGLGHYDRPGIYRPGWDDDTALAG
jgi:hypothetical protein